MSWKEDMISNGKVRLKEIQTENSELVRKMRANDVEAEEIMATIRTLEPSLKKASIEDVLAERSPPAEPPKAEEQMNGAVKSKNNNKPAATGKKIKKGVRAKTRKPSK